MDFPATLAFRLFATKPSITMCEELNTMTGWILRVPKAGTQAVLRQFYVEQGTKSADSHSIRKSSAGCE
jgi:hypothetical protein